MSSPQKRGPTDRARVGRPRVAALDQAIIVTAARLFADIGYANTRMDNVAKAAGVGKQAIYRRWASKADLAIAAFRLQAEEATVESQDMRAYVGQMVEVFARFGDLFRALLAEAQSDARTLAALKSSLIEPRSIVLEALIRAEHPAMPACEVDARLSLLSGAFWFRLMTDQPLDLRIAVRLADIAMRA